MIPLIIISELFKMCIRDRYYSGTRLQWEKIRISMSASDNQYLVQADIHCFGTPVDVTLQYQDVEKTDWFAAPLQYLAAHDYLREMLSLIPN